MDSLITVLVLLALSALSTWIQKRRIDAERRSRPGAPTPRLPRPSSRPPAGPGAPAHPEKPVWDWQAELRRILTEEVGEAPQPNPPPPIIRTLPRQQPSAQAPPVMASPGPKQSETDALDSKKEAASPQLVAKEAERVFTEAQQDIDVRARELETKTPRSHLDIREKAAQLRSAVAARAASMTKEAQAKVVLNPIIQVQRDVQPAVQMSAALASLKDPAAARDAFLSALVFGSPRGLE